MRSSIDFSLSSSEVFNNLWHVNKLVNEIMTINLIQKVLISKPKIRCFCLSDIHADSEKNQIWVRKMCEALKKDDSFFSVMVVPGIQCFHFCMLALSFLNV